MDFLFNLGIFVSIYGIASVSLNYVTGYSGVVSVAHGAFAGVGAYTVAILMKTHGFAFFPSLFIALLVTAMVAALVSIPVLKLKDDSQMLVTFGFAIIIYNLLLNLGDLTNGPLGIKGVPVPDIFGLNFYDKGNFFILSLALLVFVLLFFWIIVNSPYGSVIKGVRENPKVVDSLGHNSKAYQRSAFVLGSTFAAIAGALFATHITYIEPNSFDLLLSVNILIMIILGGLGNVWGGLLGAFILTLIPDLLRFVGLPDSIMAEMQQIIYGLVLVLLMYYRPQGLIGKFKL